ncbi:dynein regulatory complex protein 9-like [Solea solea]|uniref:dynein regulatory complex protein 9-like n=1 Tax=Solea solea TaxID=90069 RepID=UPI00272B8B87|nr:dynein regulatory complex protein 9-like [Solea solea]
MSLSKIQSLRLAAVLEDCSDQLDILGHTLRVPAGREQGTAAVQERARLTKLRRDCQFTQQVVYKLHVELEQRQSFTSLLLQEELEETRRRGREEEQRKKEETIQREAERELEQRKQHLQRQQEELQESTKKLKVLEDLYRQQSLEADYTKIMEKYTELQLQQTQKDMNRAEEHLEEQLRLLQKQLDEEARVHEESEKFLQNQHEHLQQELLQSQQRTKLMLQEKEEQLNSVRRRRTVNMDKLSEMRRKFAEMEQVVMEDREEQEKLNQKQAEAGAATMLQAWWRGCMVRKGLGSFEKAEKTKKGKKSKEGKKKKKKK